MPSADPIKKSVDLAISERILGEKQEEAFFIADLAEVTTLLEQWHAVFPTISPFYAVKCNPDVGVISRLMELGAGFDCASLGEMKLVLGLGVDPTRIIFANPCKATSHIQFAKENGIAKLTFDNVSELDKVKQAFPSADLILRIATNDSGSKWKLSAKFGATPTQMRSLLDAVKERQLNLVGVSFHVGSECGEAAAYSEAMSSAAEAFAYATSLGFKPTILDIGGGFHGRNSKSKVSMEGLSSLIHHSLEEDFSKYKNLLVISEPGRYFVESVFTLAVRIHSKRPSHESSPCMYYVNDGLFGSLNGKLYGEALPPFQILRSTGTKLVKVQSEELAPSHVWGPTCDATDLILDNSLLPDLLIDDWLVFPNLGAYTLAIATHFNGYPPARVFYINK